ncbi:GNAT family N-acetyltransferase [Goodfellowiella coeruleoviolacea]|uniref:Protein N-acetyltransferase, RimJ/RimL family n=1 Tax=Goodfellowiella coeruleoviolacea TaxID=334858 RepID=A0AAE3GGL1_9PSEU|nr:GNAT family N-acetyltransferase [Goodfellowiella coeruleoviolacea]MCP2166974.1 Protein N-acetyltransferase, RimJ/RimL family [Goodfellowiella coeruleoviolacea]
MATVLPDQLRTGRLLLARVRQEDLAEVVRVQCDPEANRHNPAGPPTPAQAGAQLAEWLDHWARHGFGYWLVTAVEPGTVVGLGGLRRHELDGTPVLNLYYRFSPAAWGKGYAPEMAAAALDWADRALPQLPVVIITQPTNSAAVRVAHKLGFRPTGETTGDPDLGHGPELVFRRPGGSPAPGGQESTMVT